MRALAANDTRRSKGLLMWRSRPLGYWPPRVWYGVTHLYHMNTLWSPVRYSFRMSHSQPRLNRPTGARTPLRPIVSGRFARHLVVVVTRLNQIGLQLTPQCVRVVACALGLRLPRARVTPVRKAYNGEVVHS